MNIGFFQMQLEDLFLTFLFLLLTILTRDKHQIQWGHAPDAETAGEPAADEKLRRLRAWLATARQKTERQRIDLRQATRGAGLPVSNTATPATTRQ